MRISEMTMQTIDKITHYVLVGLLLAGCVSTSQSPKTESINSKMQHELKKAIEAKKAVAMPESVKEALLPPLKVAGTKNRSQTLGAAL
jgi:uncharacterized protein YcfL